ncbi:MAG: hypothetical protein ACRDTH_15845 [Pseudonocardiaceae bacterium]
MNQNTDTITAPAEIHPSWCGKDGCYGQIADTAAHATQIVERGSASAQVVQVVAWVGGHNVDQSPHALVWMNGNPVGENGRSGHELSAQDCRDLSAVLLSVADELEGVRVGA